MTATWTGIGYADNPADYSLRARNAGEKFINQLDNIWDTMP